MRALLVSPIEMEDLLLRAKPMLRPAPAPETPASLENDAMYMFSLEEDMVEEVVPTATDQTQEVLNRLQYLLGPTTLAEEAVRNARKMTVPYSHHRAWGGGL